MRIPVLAIFSVLVLVLEYERVLRLTYLLASGSPEFFGGDLHD
jgi:hypothetical protein